MLYSNESSSAPYNYHQYKLKLRVTQNVINEVVRSQPLTCTHFDAWRFFHPDTQAMNTHPVLTRASQDVHEQPACIHANMDLFKYAYELYPLVSSDLLLHSLELAIEARKIDMRASPYDVSSFEGCEVPICIETAAGKRQYVLEQSRLADKALPLRVELMNVYHEALHGTQ